MSSQSNFWSAVSRIWLVLVNIVFFGVSLLALVLAGGILNLSTQAANKYATNSFMHGFDIRAVAYALIILGVFFASTAIAGCSGGLCRLSHFLTFYIGAILFDTLLLAIAGFYAIYKSVERKNNWNQLTFATWNNLTDTTKDFTQQAFHCCGYVKGDNSSYTGVCTNFWNATTVPSNPCAVANNTLSGCKEAGDGIYTHFSNIITIATVIGLATCILSVMAANAARRRRALVEQGFLRTKQEYRPLI